MTNCISARELGKETLLAYLHDEADEQVVLHLNECAFCRKRAREMARFHDGLTRRLYRMDCPAPAQLGEYHLGMLSKEEMESVAQHLNGCAHCTREVAQLESYLQDLVPEVEPGFIERVWERTRVLLADLVDEGAPRRSGQPVLAPALPGLRGKDSTPQFYEAEEITVAIEGKLDDRRVDRWNLVGLVIGLEAGAGAEALLWQEGRRLASQAVSETGSFVFGDLAPGAYDLVILAGPVEVHIRDVQVGGGEGGHDRSEPDRSLDRPDRD